MREIIVVDDHSTDQTSRVATEGGAKVLASGPLPAGWLGKPWACWQGARAASGGTFLFLDADTELEPRGLSRIVAAQRSRGGLVSLWPWHAMRKPYEWLSAFFAIIIMAAMRASTILGTRVAPLGAFGPCVICSRKDYEAAGGHEAVRGSVLEDVELGRAFLASGCPVHCLGGGGAIRFRMYPDGIRTLVTGFSKNMASGAGAASAPVLALVIAWISGGCVVTFLAITSLLPAPGVPVWPWLGMDALYVLQVAWMLARLGAYPLPVAILYQVPLAFFAAVFAQSLVRTFLLRRVSWKGRIIVLPTGRDSGHRRAP